MKVILRKYDETSAIEPLRRAANAKQSSLLVWLTALDDNDEVWFETVFDEWVDALPALAFATTDNGAKWVVQPDAALILMEMAMAHGEKAALAVSVLEGLREAISIRPEEKKNHD